MSKFHGDSFVADWHSGCFHREMAGLRLENDTVVTIVMAGDWAPSVKQQKALLGNSTEFYGDIASVFADAELSIVNVEMPVAGDWTPIIKDGPSLSVSFNAVGAGLGSLGCSVACLANNHIMDYGEPGLIATLNALSALGIQALGAGKDQDEAIQPVVVDINGCRIGLLNMAEGEEAKASHQSPGAAPLDIPWVCQQVKTLTELVDVVVVIVHAGREYVPVPPPYIREAYRMLADAGASLIIGHHPHVPQGVELWNGVPIAYSLGNFVFEVTPEVWPRNVGSLLVAKISKSGIVGFEIKPYEINEDGLTLLTGTRRATLLAELEQASANIASPFLEELWDAYADLWWQLRLPHELMSFSTLVSWQDFVMAVGYRVSIEGQNRQGLQKLMRRVSHRILRLTAKYTPSQEIIDRRIAAVMRNRFDTPAHSQLYQTALARAIEGKIGQSATWARDELKKWGALN